MAGEAGELAFVATLRDEASAAARSARQALDSVGGQTRPIETAVLVDASRARASITDAERALDGLDPAARAAGQAAGAGLEAGLSGVPNDARRAGQEASAALAAGLSGVPAAAASVGDDAGAELEGGILDALTGTGGKVTGLIAGLGIGAALTESMSQEFSTDKLAASLGATATQSEQLGKVAGNLYAGAWGESLDSVSDAVGAVASTISGIGHGKRLEQASIEALNYATIFDVDVTRAANSAGIAIKSGLAKNATEAFDLMTAASQKVPAQLREDVLDATDEYGQFFAALGYDGPAAFGVLAAAGQKGMIGLDKAGDAVKEFTIRSTDMSQSSKDAYKAIGLDAQTMAGQILKGGDSAKGATDKIISGILGIRDPVKRANTAIALFGTPLEDIGVNEIPKFLKGLTSAKSGLRGVEGAAKRSGDVLNDNASTNLKSFGRQAKQAFVNVVGGQVLPIAQDVAAFLATNFAPAFETASDAVKSTVGFLKEHSTVAKALAIVIGALVLVTGAHAAVLAVAAAGGMVQYLKGLRLISAVTKVAAAVQWALNAAMAANPFVLIALLIAGLVLAVVLLWRKNEAFRAAVIAAWNAIKSAISTAVEAIKSAVGAGWDWIKNAVSSAISFVVDFVRNHWLLLVAIITGPLGLIVGLVVRYWDQIKAAVGAAIGFVKGIVVGGFRLIAAGIRTYVAVWRAIITAVWSAIRAIVSGAVNGVKAVVTTVFRAIGTAIRTYVNAWRTIITTVWNAIRSVVSGAVSGVRSVVTGGFSAIRSGISSAMSTIRSSVSNAWNAIKSTVTSKIHEVVSLVKGLPGKITGALGDLGGLLKDAGRKIIQGLLDGIDEMFGKVQDKLSSLTSKLPDWKGPPKRDSVLLRPAGRLIIRGLIGGFDDEIPYVKAKLRGLTATIRKVGTDAARGSTSALSGTLKSLTGQLDKMLDARSKAITARLRKMYDGKGEKQLLAAATKRLAAARAAEEKVIDRATAKVKANIAARNALIGRIKAAKAAAAEYAKAVADGAKITSVERTNDTPLTAGFALANLRKRLEAIKEYRANLAKMRALKYDAATIRQVEEAGVEGGGELAAALAAGTRAEVKSIAYTQQQIAAQAKATGKETTAGLVAGLEADLKKVTKAGTRIARALIAAIRKELKIHSPSRVTRGDGQNTTAGLIGGVLDDLTGVARAGTTVADVLASSMVPTLPDLASMANAAAFRPLLAVRSESVIVIRHEVTSPDGSVDELTAEEIADLIARDPKAARRLESVLRPARRRTDRNTISSSD